MSSWRFLKPIENKCRVVFAGSNFQAGLPFTLDALSSRNDHRLKEVVEIVHAPTKEVLLQEAKSAHVVVPFMEPLSEEFFHPNISPQLRLAIQYGVGLERVNIDAATNAGVAISNVPGDGSRNAEATSEHALFLAMSLLRHAKYDLNRRFMKQQLGGFPIPQTLYNKRVTVVGYGSIGTVLCRYLVTMGAKKVMVVRNRCWSLSQNSDDSIEKMNKLEDALPETDILFLACTVTPKTLHMINEDRISLLPRGSYIVNVGRGPLVEYHAILNAIKTGQVGGFASDVGVGHPTKVSEPWDPTDELSNSENVIFTPHTGGYCDYPFEHMSHKIVDAVHAIVDGKPPPVWINQ